MEKGSMLMSNCRFIAAFLRKYCSVAVGSSMVRFSRLPLSLPASLSIAIKNLFAKKKQGRSFGESWRGRLALLHGSRAVAEEAGSLPDGALV